MSICIPVLSIDRDDDPAYDEPGDALSTAVEAPATDWNLGFTNGREVEP